PTHRPPLHRSPAGLGAAPGRCAPHAARGHPGVTPRPATDDRGVRLRAPVRPRRRDVHGVAAAARADRRRRDARGRVLPPRQRRDLGRGAHPRSHLMAGTGKGHLRPDGAVLTVEDLTVEYTTNAGIVHAVSGISFDLMPGE